MSILKHTVTLLALFAILGLALARVAQGGPHQNQGRVRRQAVQDGPEDVDDLGRSYVNWTTCDLTVTPKYSCQDCSTRLICLPIGGKVVACNAFKPYCNNGFCSGIPSAQCASV